VSDRSLALLYGRSLCALNVFTDVTYTYSLRDSHEELYKLNSTQHESGIFMILTDCYSSTCVDNAYCYSVTCPRKLLPSNPADFTAKSKSDQQDVHYSNTDLG
jgi:hypothetical protein